MPTVNNPFMGIDIRQADLAIDIGGVSSLLKASFKQSYPRLWPLMYEDRPSDELHSVVKNILNTHLKSEDCTFMVAYNNSDDERLERAARSQGNGLAVGSDHDSYKDFKHLTCGVISLSLARSAADRDPYATSDLRTYAYLGVLNQELDTGDNRVNRGDSRFGLVNELEYQSRFGQAYLPYPYLVVNALLLRPECHEDVVRDMAAQLLGWAVTVAETNRQRLGIWAQVPVNQKGFFLQAGFTERESVELKLNDYEPQGSRGDCRMQEWVNMVYDSSGIGGCEIRGGRASETVDD